MADLMLWRAWVSVPAVPGPGVIRAGSEFTAPADDPRCGSGRALLLGPAVAAPAVVPAGVAEALEAAAAVPASKPVRKRAPRATQK